jgi:hypothetical protein
MDCLHGERILLRRCLFGRVSDFFVFVVMVDWFKGLSGKFLGSRAGKLLLLAGTDRLDKPLMIGQMQGTLPPGTVICFA